MLDVYEMYILVRPGTGSTMPPHAAGGETVCFAAGSGHEEAVRLACAELNSRGYVCERLIGDSIGQVDMSRWEEHAEDICTRVTARLPVSAESVRAGLPAPDALRELAAEGGFRLGPFFCWENEPDEELEPEGEPGGDLTAEQMTRHDELYTRGCDLVVDLIYFDHRPYQQPDDAARARLREGIECLEEALTLNPSNWQALLFRGKALESLGEREQALESLLRAHEIEPTQVAVAAEAGGAAGRVGRHDVAIRVMESVARHHPEDPRLPCNIGISRLLMGDAEGARAAFERTIELEPDRDGNRRLLKLADDVASGRRPCPKTESELAKALA